MDAEIGVGPVGGGEEGAGAVRTRKEKPETMRRAYKFRVYPNKLTIQNAESIMLRLGEGPWDKLHEQYRRSQEAWHRVYDPRVAQEKERLGRDLTKDEYQSLWKQVGREHGYPISGKGNAQYDERVRSCIRKRDHELEYEGLNAQMIEDVATKFVGSVKSYDQLRAHGDMKARPPKRKHLHPCLTFRQSGWQMAPLSDGWAALTLNGIGRFRVRMHRDIEGTIKTVSVIRDEQKWYACFSCELPRKAPVAAEGRKDRVRIEFVFAGGTFLRDSDGREVRFPAFYWAAVANVRRLGRSKSRKTGPANYAKARKILRDCHAHIREKRSRWLWKEANHYAQHYRHIEIPKWPFKEMIHYAVSSSEAVRLCDASYARFVAMLKCKCEQFGSQWVEYRDARQETDAALRARVARTESERKFLRQLASSGEDIEWRRHLSRGLKRLRKLHEKEKDYGKRTQTDRRDDHARAQGQAERHVLPQAAGLL